MGTTRLEAAHMNGCAECATCARSAADYANAGGSTGLKFRSGTVGSRGCWARIVTSADR